jgi:hypothetical protein
VVPLYRKLQGADTWHWCKNCTKWPEFHYDNKYLMRKERPKTGELCDECKAKEIRGGCRT